MNLDQTLQKIRDRLYPWQVEWLKDESDRKIYLKARQIGISSVGTLRALLKAWKLPGHRFYLLSKTVTQAQEDLLRIIKRIWLPAFQANGHLKDTEVQSKKIILPNGSEVLAEANSPSKIRGKSDSSFLCDEVGHWNYNTLKEIEAAIDPIVSNNENSSWEMISTPWARDNLFHDIWINHKDRYSNWSRHETDIYDAYQHDPFSSSREWTIEDKRKEMSSQKFSTQYECSFLETSNFFFTKAELQPLFTDQSLSLEGSERQVGIDIGQKDRTVITLSQSYDNNGIVYVEKIRQMQDEKFSHQEEMIAELLENWEWDKVLIDATMHSPLSESLEDRFQNVHGLQGDRERKVDRSHELKKLVEHENLLFSKDNKMLDNGSWRPCSISIIDDFTKVQQTITPAGNAKFEAARGPNGHADIYDSVLLALHCSHHQNARYLGSL